MLIIFTGLPASGKSAVAQRLRTSLDAVLLDKDVVRGCLFAGHIEYERPQDDLCVTIMYEVAAYHLRKRPQVPVILDGRTYSRRYQIDAVKQAAETMQVPACFIECVCAPETAKLRLDTDAGTHPAQDRNYELYLRSRAAAEPIAEPRLVLDTDKLDVETCLQRVLAHIQDYRQC